MMYAISHHIILYHIIFLLWHMFVVMFFLFVICVCVLATMFTVVVIHLYLRAETHPVTPMPSWVCRNCIQIFSTFKHYIAVNYLLLQQIAADSSK